MQQSALPGLVAFRRDNSGAAWELTCRYSFFLVFCCSTTYYSKKRAKKKKKRFTLKRLNTLCNDECSFSVDTVCQQMMSTACMSKVSLLKSSGNKKIALSNSKNNCHFIRLCKKKKKKQQQKGKRKLYKEKEKIMIGLFNK